MCNGRLLVVSLKPKKSQEKVITALEGKRCHITSIHKSYHEMLSPYFPEWEDPVAKLLQSHDFGTLTSGLLAIDGLISSNSSTQSKHVFEVPSLLACRETGATQDHRRSRKIIAVSVVSSKKVIEKLLHPQTMSFTYQYV